MPVSHSGNIYQFCSRAQNIEEFLPAGIFEILFHPQAGYSLMRTELPPADKMFGDMACKIPKVVDTFKRRPGNTGIILSGDKGLGKTLFARHLCQAVVSAGYPVLKITENTPGITQFIGAIEQPVMLFFDEFAKIFPTGRHDNDDGAQTDFLTLLDGTGCGKRLTVVTCNKEDGLSTYFTNRPGRFYYKFHFEYPGMDTVKAFLQAQGITDKRMIDKMATVASLLKVNFDSLRAIGEELLQGYSITETLSDLNLTDSSSTRTMRFAAEDENGVTWTSNDAKYDYLRFTMTLNPSASKASYWNPVRKSGTAKGKLKPSVIKTHDFIIYLDVSKLRPIADGVYELKGTELGEVKDTEGPAASRYKAKIVKCRLYDVSKPQSTLADSFSNLE